MFALSVVWFCGAAYAGISVMVLPFQNNASEAEYAPLGLGLQSMITSDLAYSDDLVVVERSRLQEVLAELDFQQSKYVDPATAVKIGKAVSATHYVHGSFTVVGGNMRLDARLVDIATQSVVAQADLTGEKDAFFELEKDVVKKFLAGIGAVLTPKERGDIGRVQTTDMGALVKYSGGLQLYDSAQYDEAIVILEQVAAEDPNFTLASRTAAEIEQAAAEAALRAQAARVAAAVRDFVAHTAEAEQAALRIAELQAIGADASRTWQDRATADLLVVHLSHVDWPIGAAADRFALQRLGDRSYQAFWNELRAQQGQKWYPVIADAYVRPEWDVEKLISSNRKTWFESTQSPTALSWCPEMVRKMDIDEEYARLWVPHSRRLELARNLLVESGPCSDRYPRQMMELANMFRGAGHLGPASVILQDLSKQSKDPDVLGKVAGLLEDLAEEQKIVERFKPGTIEREKLLPLNAWSPRSGYFGRGVNRDWSVTKAEAADDPYRGYVALRSVFDRQIPLFINGVPAWAASRLLGVETGPRTAIDETKALRFYGQKPPEPGDVGTRQRPMVFVIGGAPRGDVAAQVTVDNRPPADGWYKPAEANPPRPAAGILFGLRELATFPVVDPLDPTHQTPNPTTGYAAVIVEGRLVIAEVKEVFPDEPDGATSEDHLKGLEIGPPLAKSGRLPDLPSTPISLKVKGSIVAATAGAVTVKAELPSAPMGFVALYADGEGFVELRDPTLQ